MPLYEYECRACGRRFEQIQKFSDPPAAVCPHCGAGEVEKLLSTPAIQFKGSGWYITDYARKGGEAGDKAASKHDGETKDAKDTKETKDTKESKPSSSESGSKSSPGSGSTKSD